MDMCSLSVMRMPPLRPSVIAAASVTAPVSQTKVGLCAHVDVQLCKFMYRFFFVGVSTSAWASVCSLRALVIKKECTSLSCGLNFAIKLFGKCPVTPINTVKHIKYLLLVVLPGGEASEDAAQEDFQYKLKGFIDSTVDKR